MEERDNDTVDRADETLKKIVKDGLEAATIGRYKILGILGRGNMGEVFRARDPMIGRLVALKTRRFDLVFDKKDLQFIIDKFFEEARIVGNLVHPNIVTVFDLGQDGDYCYIAMELLEGEDLTSFNTEDTLLAIDEVVEMIGKVCHALDFAHSHGVIHRDIKPANIMHTKDHGIKITDFGIAMPVQSGKTSELQVIGTPSYMSPEQTKGLRLTNQTDFYSLGVVLFELLCGSRPFRGRTLYELMDDIRYAPAPSILEFRPDLPQGVDMVLQRALEKEPELRYRTGKEFADELERAIKGDAPPVRDLKASKKAELIKSVRFFRAFSIQEIEDMTRIGTFIRYDKGHVVLREGDIDTTFFVLLSGTVRVIKNNKKIADLTKGACIGEMGAFCNSPRTAHVIAKTPCLVIKLDLKVLARENEALKYKFYEIFIQTLSERLELTTMRLSRKEPSKGSKDKPRDLTDKTKTKDLAEVTEQTQDSTQHSKDKTRKTENSNAGE